MNLRCAWTGPQAALVFDMGLYEFGAFSAISHNLANSIALASLLHVITGQWHDKIV